MHRVSQIRLLLGIVQDDPQSVDIGDAVELNRGEDAGQIAAFHEHRRLPTQRGFDELTHGHWSGLGCRRDAC